MQQLEGLLLLSVRLSMPPAAKNEALDPPQLIRIRLWALKINQSYVGESNRMEEGVSFKI